MFLDHAKKWARVGEDARSAQPSTSSPASALGLWADQLIGMPVESVVDKPLLPYSPSTDRHSFQSIATYYWPNPHSVDGLPFLERDGVPSPLLNEYDYPRWRRTADVIGLLTRAGVILRRPECLVSAADRLRRWFIEPETAMRPHLDNAQFAPGCNTGRAAGVIDFAILLPCLLECESIVHDDPVSGWTAGDRTSLRGWFDALFHWLQTSPIALEESAATNNHAVYFDVLITAVALFVGDTEFAQRRVAAAVRERLAVQMRSDGSLPNELSRTLSLTYTVLHLGAYALLARLGSVVGIDLWRAQAGSGQGMVTGLQFLAKTLAMPGGWPFTQITPLPPNRLERLLVMAADGLGDCRVAELFPSRLPDTVKRQLLMVDESVNPLLEIRHDILTPPAEVRYV